ncbi:predicted protein [Sclerotinia sclerotiorum 1980 UF-70]|uniref:Uncharacterized protein n=1 Tax=Sclerotinia sclerotiorum (strain ATCC 18683 / 1980 / Ss-1) TaxID=665079 RepID=A7F905_SCLS1|nr:predicted protein [Sclerotinia sclerotiorum 1980 UF-70]EDN99226.1 predicted protein [Sclerotinia sclerotiorum 1980 UF-70]
MDQYTRQGPGSRVPFFIIHISLESRDGGASRVFRIGSLTCQIGILDQGIKESTNEMFLLCVENHRKLYTFDQLQKTLANVMECPLMDRRFFSWLWPYLPIF